MAEGVVTCLKLCKPYPLLLSNFFNHPTLDIRALASKRSKLQTSLRDLDITGDCEEVLHQALEYARHWKLYWSRPDARTHTTLHPLAFIWSPLFQEQTFMVSSKGTRKGGDEDVEEGSTCVWFELAMIYMVCCQLYYSLGVDSLEEYKQSSQLEDAKRSGIYFQNAAYMALEAERVVQELWTTQPLDFDPAVRDSRTTRIWLELCLAGAQHCCCMVLQSKPEKSITNMSKLFMAEAQQYSKVLQYMQALKMSHVMKNLHKQVATLYIETLSAATIACLNSEETDEINVCKKETALLQVHNVLKKQLPNFSLEKLQKELETICTLRTKVYHLRRKENESVPRTMIPVPHLAVKPLPPS